MGIPHQPFRAGYSAHILMNKKGFSLITVVLSLFFIGIIAAMCGAFMKMNTDSISLRINLLEKNKLAQDFSIIRESIKNGFIHRYEELADNIITTDKKFHFYTSYYSHDIKSPNLYKIECDENKLTLGFPDSVQYKVVDNLFFCKITYYDSNNIETTETDKVSNVELKFSYKQNGEEQTYVIKQKLMQES